VKNPALPGTYTAERPPPRSSTAPSAAPELPGLSAPLVRTPQQPTHTKGGRSAGARSAVKADNLVFDSAPCRFPPPVVHSSFPGVRVQVSSPCVCAQFGIEMIRALFGASSLIFSSCRRNPAEWIDFNKLKNWMYLGLF